MATKRQIDEAREIVEKYVDYFRKAKGVDPEVIRLTEKHYNAFCEISPTAVFNGIPVTFNYD